MTEGEARRPLVVYHLYVRNKHTLPCPTGSHGARLHLLRYRA